MNAIVQPTKINNAASWMEAGGVICYPTEAVWGLGADPWNADAVTQILSLKRRPIDKGLILVGADESHFDFLLDSLPHSQRLKVSMSWPGPNTWLVPHRGLIPNWISGQHESVAVRVSAHPVVRALCQRFAGPIVSTSANPQGNAPATSALRARVYFGSAVYYVPGTVDTSARPSVIRDVQSDRIIRA